MDSEVEAQIRDHIDLFWTSADSPNSKAVPAILARAVSASIPAKGMVPYSYYNHSFTYLKRSLKAAESMVPDSYTRAY